jgi:hypothetical protein
MQDDDVLSATRVAQLLRRAATVDAVLGDSLTVAQLRAVAREAGISDTALRVAMTELEQDQHNDAISSSSRRRRVVDQVVRTVAVGIVVAGSMRLLVPLTRLIDADVGAAIGLIASLSLGMATARRLRARIAELATAGLGVALVAELALTVSVGPIRGLSAHLAEFVAALGGVAAGVWLSRRRSAALTPLSPSVSLEEEPERVDAEPRRSWRTWLVERPGAVAIPALLLCVHATVAAQAAPSVITTLRSERTLVSARAIGTFDVKTTPQPADGYADGGMLGRLTIDKQFRGDLQATSTGQMLSAMTSTTGSAGYVAIERVTGTLAGRRGTFILQHSGTMSRGEPRLIVSVVPDSGTDALIGLTGTMTIDTSGGRHAYEFMYTLPSVP